MSAFLQRLRPLPVSIALATSAFAAALLIGISSLLPMPILLATMGLVSWSVSSFLLVGAGIEALAAIEPWIENDVRFFR